RGGDLDPYRLLLQSGRGGGVLRAPGGRGRRCFEELAGDDFTLQQFSVCLHDKPVGAVRVSVGFSSNETDIDRLIALLEGFRDRVAPRGEPGAGQVAVGTAASA